MQNPFGHGGRAVLQCPAVPRAALYFFRVPGEGHLASDYRRLASLASPGVGDLSAPLSPHYPDPLRAFVFLPSRRATQKRRQRIASSGRNTAGPRNIDTSKNKQKFVAVEFRQP